MFSVDAPSLKEFLAAPAVEVTYAAPESLIFAAGGTRRRVVMDGYAADSEEYARVSREHMIGAINLFFRLGVKNLFMTAIRPGQLSEVGRYRERIVSWVDWVLSGPESLADFQRHGWAARLVGTESVPELEATAERMRAATPGPAEHTVWWYVHSSPESPWDRVIRTLGQSGARSRSEAIIALYGQPIPLVTMYIGFGKPLTSPDLVPPLLAGEMQCYWTQRPGSDIDEHTVRAIFYDYAYLRRTWKQDKRARYEQIAANRSLWERQQILGMGRKFGDFWYPADQAD